MNIKPNILAELSQLVIVNNTACITRQLDRKTYVEVNECLVALGGKWDRKAKAHVFPEDPTARIDAAIDLGEVTTAKDLGFFATPLMLAASLVVEHAGVTRGSRVLEPSAGEGAIAMAVMDAGAYVTCIEYDGRRRATLARNVEAHAALLTRIGCSSDYNVVGGNRRSLVPPDEFHDFMNYTPVEPFDFVVMNPPFAKIGKGDHLDHVRHAFDMLAPGGVLVSVLPSSVEFRQDRRHREFRAFVEEHDGAITPLPERSFRASGTDVNTVVVRLVKS